MRDKNTSVRVCAKNAGGLMRQGGHICGTLWYLLYVEGTYVEGSVCLV